MTASLSPTNRYVLPEDAPYLANLAALWAVDPALAARIEAVDDAACYPIEPSRNGEPTAAVTTADGRRVYLHSRYRPLDEAAKLVENIDFQSNFVFHIHGFGLGYLPQQVFDRASEDALLCIHEPDLAVLKTAFFARDLSAMIASRRLMFFCDLNKADLFTRLAPCIALLAAGCTTLVHAPSMQLQPAFHQQMREWVEQFNSYSATNLSTLLTNGRRTCENIARNLGWYLATPSIARLKDRHRGQPAIIVSAGPSLRKNKHLLADACGKAVIIAVQTTLQPLLDMGIEPHYVTSLDYHDICTRFYEKLPPTLRTHLVAEPKASDRIFSMYPGSVSVLGNDFAESLLRENPPNKERLTAGATVAHLAFYLAEYLGCNPIIFIGQDLGFSDGLCYTPGTSYEDVWQPELSRFCTLEMKQWEQIVRDRQILRRIPDCHGNPMYTEQRLYTYLQQFERDFARTDRTVIDATEGGALKRGAINMTLAEAIARHCTQPVRPPQADPQPLRWDRLDAGIASLDNRLREARQIEQIASETLPLLREVRDHLQDQRRVNRAIARIDALRARMNELGPCYDLVMQLAQKTELERFKRDRAIAAADLDPLERQRRQVERDIDNVSGVVSAAADFQQLMANVIERLQNQRLVYQSKEAA